MKPKTADRQTRDAGVRKEVARDEGRETRDERAECRRREAKGRQSEDRGQALDHGGRHDKDGGGLGSAESVEAASKPRYQPSFVQAFQRALKQIETRCAQPSAPCNHHMPHSGWERATGPHVPHEHLPLMSRASIESLWNDRNTSCSLSTASPLRTLLDERRWLQQVSRQEPVPW